MAGKKTPRSKPRNRRLRADTVTGPVTLEEARALAAGVRRVRAPRRGPAMASTSSAWDAMLFSGGGNDIVGNPLALWVKDFDAAIPISDHIHPKRYAAAIALVRAGYEDLILLRDRLSPETKLIFHVYDFAIPDGRGVCHLGPWLKPAFDLRGFPNQAGAAQVVKVMLQGFAEMLSNVTDLHRNAHLINTQGTLAPVSASWHNELHPAKKGFDQMAERFHDELRRLFPNKVL